MALWVALVVLLGAAGAAAAGPVVALASVRLAPGLPSPVLGGNIARVHVVVRNDGDAVAASPRRPPAEQRSDQWYGFPRPEPQTWRVGIYFVGSDPPQDNAVPFRWDLNGDLAPGESRELVLPLRITTGFVREWVAVVLQELPGQRVVVHSRQQIPAIEFVERPQLEITGVKVPVSGVEGTDLTIVVDVRNNWHTFSQECGRRRQHKRPGLWRLGYALDAKQNYGQNLVCANFRLNHHQVGSLTWTLQLPVGLHEIHFALKQNPNLLFQTGAFRTPISIAPRKGELVLASARVRNERPKPGGTVEILVTVRNEGTKRSGACNPNKNRPIFDDAPPPKDRMLIHPNVGTWLVALGRGAPAEEMRVDEFLWSFCVGQVEVNQEREIAIQMRANRRVNETYFLGLFEVGSEMTASGALAPFEVAPALGCFDGCTHGTCDPIAGTCQCDDGYTGRDCSCLLVNGIKRKGTCQLARWFRRPAFPARDIRRHWRTVARDNVPREISVYCPKRPTVSIQDLPSDDTNECLSLRLSSPNLDSRYRVYCAYDDGDADFE